MTHVSRSFFLLTAFLFVHALTSSAQVPTPGLALWLRADAFSGTTTGDSISMWRNMADTSRNAASVGTARPVYIGGRLNGLPVLRFAGTSGTTSRGSSMSAPISTGGFVTAFVVVANRRPALVQQAVDVVIASKTSGDPAQGFTGFGLSTFNGFANSGLRRFTAESAGNATLALRKNGSSSAPLRVNENEFAIGTYIGYNVRNGGSRNGQASGSAVSINSFVGETEGFYGEHDIAEILLYTVPLSSREILQVENYLSEKYSIAVAGDPAFMSSAKPLRGAEYRTKDAYRHGRFEVRMKSAQASGMLTTFFTYHDTPNQPQEWNEIDIEILGRYSNEVQFNVITQGEVSHVRRQVVNFNPHQDFHDYAFEWTPSYVAWFIDGTEVYRQTEMHIRGLIYPQKIMMNIWQPIWTDWTGTWNPAVLPLYGFYEQVRYASFTPGSGTFGTDNNFTPLWSDDLNAFNPVRWERATHTWDANNAQFVPDNVVFQNGRMVLCLTNPENVGFARVEQISSQKPTAFQLEQNYPNPFNPSTAIRYQVSATSAVRLAVFDMLGRQVATLVNERQAAGSYQVTFNAANLASGTYFYRLQAGAFTETRKMMLVK
jgi:beta-glucanase (GH16 family)